ncbi:hypothetical protein PFNF54_00083 [Plasmodium falciparum NF54]|nr:hypothetical protein PFNF54_00083 [Plasmodium falciparum NF54]
MNNNKTPINDINVKYVEALNSQFNFLSRDSRKIDTENNAINILNFSNDLEKKSNNTMVDICEKTNDKKI